MSPRRNVNSSKPTRPRRSISRQNNVARGLYFEKWFAERNGGAVYPGTDGDVDAHGYRVECKLRSALGSYGELHDHIEQAQRNSRASGKPWALALTGGNEYQDYAAFVLVPFEEWDRLCRLEDDKRALSQLAGSDPYDKLSAAFSEAVRQATEALHGRRGDTPAGG